MKMMQWLFALVLTASSGTGALAQSTILQGGPWAQGHAPMYVGTGSSQAVVQDSGSAGGGPVGTGLSELNITSRSGNGVTTAPYADNGNGPYKTHNCAFDAPITNSTGYHYLCTDPNAQGGGLIAYGAAGGAASLPLSFIINGTSYQFPFAVGGVVGPATTTIGHIATWNNTNGTLLADTAQIALDNLPSIGSNTVLGNVTGGTATPTALSKTQLTTLCNTFTSSLGGCAPASGGGVTKFLRADGTFATPAVAPNAVITRAQIPSNTIGADYFSVSGFSTAGDLGSGAQYIVGTSTGPLAIQDASGTWYQLNLAAQIPSIGWFGAKCDGTTDDTAAIVLADSTAATLGIQYIYVPYGTCSAPTLNTTASLTAAHVTFVGDGTIINAWGVRVHRSGEPTRPVFNDIQPYQLRRTASASSPLGVLVGDSISTLLPGSTKFENENLWTISTSAFQKQLPRSYTFENRACGGSTWTTFWAGTPAISNCGGWFSAAVTYTAQTANFTVTSTLTGATSGSYARITADSDAGTTGTLTINDINGNFVAGEIVTDGSGGSAKASSLNYTTRIGAFTVGQVVTGATSGAVGTIVSDTTSGTSGSLVLTSITGIFQSGETITDPLGGNATSTAVAITVPVTWYQQVQNLQPDLVMLAWGMNDGINFVPVELRAAVAGIQSWTKRPDIILITNTVPTRLATGSDFANYSNQASQEGRDFVAGYERAFAQINKMPYVDGNRSMHILRDGFDPTISDMTTVVNTLPLTTPYTPTQLSSDFDWTLGFGSTNPIGSPRKLMIATSPTGTNIRQWLALSDSGSGTVQLDLYELSAGSGTIVHNVNVNTGVTIPSTDIFYKVQFKGNYLYLWVSTTATICADGKAPFNGLCLAYSGLVQRFGGIFAPVVQMDDGSAVSFTGTYAQGTYRQTMPWLLDTSIYNSSCSNGLNHPCPAGAQDIWGPLFHDLNLAAYPVDVLPHPSYKGNYWYRFAQQGQSATGAALTASTIYCSFGVIGGAQPVTIKTLGTKITITSAGGNVQLGLYTNLNGFPGSLIASTSSLATDSLANVSAALSTNKQIGTNGADGNNKIWMCQNSDNGTAATVSFAAASLDNQHSIGSATIAAAVGTSSLNTGVSCAGANCTGGSSTFGTWPTTLTGSTWTQLTDGKAPSIAFQVFSSP